VTGKKTDKRENEKMIEFWIGLQTCDEKYRIIGTAFSGLVSTTRSFLYFASCDIKKTRKYDEIWHVDSKQQQSHTSSSVSNSFREAALIRSVSTASANRSA
jgi:hypothetical protein